MPELPEVEAARSAIAEHCIGKKIIKAIIANDDKVINGVSPSDFESSLINKTIVAAHRKGKNMWLELDSPPFPSFQFGMTGAVYIKGVAVTKYKRSAVSDANEWPSKFSKFFIELNGGLELSFTDPRRFAKVRLLDDPASVPPISELGPDALLEPMNEDEFYESLSKKKIAIKTLLLDQSFISGIGNWVADEVLYQARIHPSQGASSLSKECSSRLLKSIKEVIQEAVKVGADSNQYPTSWIFHSREKKREEAFVDGKKIDFITVGGRTTAYVPELQKQNGRQRKKAPGNFITVGGRTTAYVPELQKQSGRQRKKAPGNFITVGGRTTAYVPELQKQSGRQRKKAPGNFITVGGRTTAYVPELQKQSGRQRKKAPGNFITVGGRTTAYVPELQKQSGRQRKKAPGNFITVGGRTTAYVPELQKRSRRHSEKAPAKPRKQTSGKKDDDDHDDDAGDSNEEESKNPESEQVNSKGGGKKPPRRNITTKHDDEENKTRNGGSRAPPKRKSQETGGSKDGNESKKSRGERKRTSKANNDSDASDENGDQKKSSKAKGRKPRQRDRK